MVLSIIPKAESGLDLNGVRRVAENSLRDTLLNSKGASESEVFGGKVRQVEIALDRNQLTAMAFQSVK